MNGYNSDSSFQLSSDKIRDISTNSHVLSDSFLGFDPSSNEDWSPAPIEILVSDDRDEAIEKRTFNSRFVLIGRSPDCDICLNDDRISFRHAYIQKIFGRLICVDLASRTGTHWPDGKRPFGWIDEQHPIAVGSFKLRVSPSVHDEDLDDSDEPEFDAGSFFRNVSEQSILPNVSLKFLSRSSSVESWTLNRPITLVGSSTRCKLRLKHESVSRVHCSLNLMPDGLWVVDLLGKQGTLLDGEPIRSAQIPDGSRLAVGKYQFQINYAPTDQTTEQDPKTELAMPSSREGISEEFVTQLVDQITNMQQQFVKQSQQQTEMMLKFFGTMHATQHELLRDEMNRVREIEREMRELRGVMEKSQQISREMKSESTILNARQTSSTATTDAQQTGADTNAATQHTPTEHEEAASASSLHSSETSLPPENQLTQQVPPSTLEIENLRSESDPGSTSEAPEISLIEGELNQQEINQIDHSTSDTPNVDSRSELGIAPDAKNQTTQAGEYAEVDSDDSNVEEHLHATEADHTWVLNRMYQLEREKEGILRKMMRSVFRAGS